MQANIILYIAIGLGLAKVALVEFLMYNFIKMSKEPMTSAEEQELVDMQHHESNKNAVMAGFWAIENVKPTYMRLILWITPVGIFIIYNEVKEYIAKSKQKKEG